MGHLRYEGSDIFIYYDDCDNLSEDVINVLRVWEKSIYRPDPKIRWRNSELNNIWDKAPFYINKAGKFRCRDGSTDILGCIDNDGNDHSKIVYNNYLYHKSTQKEYNRFSNIIRWK